MESSQNLSSDAKTYPRNVFDRTYAPHLLDIITHQLNTQAPRLLADEAQAALDLLDLRHDAKGRSDSLPQSPLSLT